MTTVTVDDARRRFAELLDAAAHGETVIILRDALPVAKLVAAEVEGTYPTFGSQRGKIVMADDFDAPLEDFADYVP